MDTIIIDLNLENKSKALELVKNNQFLKLQIDAKSLEFQELIDRFHALLDLVAHKDSPIPTNLTSKLKKLLKRCPNIYSQFGGVNYKIKSKLKI